MTIHAAVLHMLAARFAGILLTVVFFAVLSRLLAPAVFGEYAIAIASFALARAVTEFGLRQFLIREPVLTSELVSAATGISMVLSATLCAASVAASLTLGESLLSPGLAGALIVLALALLVDPFVIATEAQLQRDLDFRLLSAVEVLRTLVDGTTAIVLALYGFGAPALAGGILVSRIVVATVLFVAGRRYWVQPGLRGWRRFRGFGLRTLGIELLPKLGSFILISVLGGALGSSVAGLYNRADTIRLILDRTILEGLRPVILPALGKSMRDGHHPLDLYTFKVDCLAAICWPGFAMIALLSEPLVSVMLGPNWGAATMPVSILAMTGLAVPFNKMSDKFFIATDLIRDHLRIQATHQLFRVLIGGAAALVSLEAFCAAVVVSTGVKAYRLERTIVRRLGRQGVSFVWIAGRNGAVTLLTLIGPAAVLHAVEPGSDLLTLGLALPLAAGGWLAGLVLLRHRLLSHMVRSVHLVGFRNFTGL